MIYSEVLYQICNTRQTEAIKLITIHSYLSNQLATLPLKSIKREETMENERKA